MSSTGQEIAHLHFVLSVLSHAGVIGVNWNRVAEENGIGYARNGASKFKDIAKKYGYKFDQNMLRRVDGNDQIASPPTTPLAKKHKTVTATVKPNDGANRKKTPAKKRKASLMEDNIFEDLAIPEQALAALKDF